MSNGNGVAPGTVIEAAPSPEPAEKKPAAASKPPRAARTPTPRHRPSKADKVAKAKAAAPATPPQPEPTPAPAPEPAATAPAPTNAPTQPQSSAWFQVLPPMPPDEGNWESIPTTLLYSSEANGYRIVSGLVVAEVEWGGGIIAFMLLPRDPLRVRLNDGSFYDVPPHQAFVAIPAVAELAAVMAKFREDPEHALGVRFKPCAIKLLEDGRPTIHFEVQVMKTPIKRADALVLKAA